MKVSPFVWFSVLAMLQSSALFAQPEVFWSQTASASAFPLNKLPSHIRPAAGKQSLVADFQSEKDGIVTLYLINATKKATLIATQDGDVYCKREAKAADGEWRRCDSHENSWCGNSYRTQEIPAQGFLTWKQKLHSKGGKASPVRFRIFHEPFLALESNEGTGEVVEADIAFCRYDSMAMSLGPFEDVAAVATGDVKGSQVSVLGSNLAISALERFYDDDRLFPLVKKVVAKLLEKQSTNERGDLEYTDCLGVLDKTMGHTISVQEGWDYVSAHVADSKFPWSNEALNWLTLHFEKSRWRELEEITTNILSKPSHSALQSAIRIYAKIPDKDVSGPRLMAISQDMSYSPEVRRLAHEVRENLFVNPYLKIRSETGEAFAKDLQPLKSVTISNISPQEIVLPVNKVEDLLFVRMIGDDACVPKKAGPEKGGIRLKPGEAIEARNVRWWKWVDAAKIKDEKSHSFILMASTPGLWDVPAEGPWLSVDQDRLLKAIQKDRE